MLLWKLLLKLTKAPHPLEVAPLEKALFLLYFFLLLDVWESASTSHSEKGWSLEEELNTQFPEATAFLSLLHPWELSRDSPSGFHFYHSPALFLAHLELSCLALQPGHSISFLSSFFSSPGSWEFFSPGFLPLWGFPSFNFFGGHLYLMPWGSCDVAWRWFCSFVFFFFLRNKQDVAVKIFLLLFPLPN